MDKLALLRKLNERLPAVMEQVINLWGTMELDSYIDRLISAPRAGAELTTEQLDILNGLKEAHGAEFPQHAATASSALAIKLAENPHFQIVKSRFPHIGAKLIATWGHVTFHQYLDTLLKDDRGGKRQGFPEEVILAIFRLTELHDLENPGAVPIIKDIWSGNS